MRVGFIGSGSIAAAIARGWARAEGGPEAMLFTDGGSGRAAALAEEVGGEAVASNRELVERSDLVVLAVKPALLGELGAEVGGGAPALLSVLGATPISALAEAFPGTPIVRAMPNLAVEAGAGVVCYAVAAGVPDALRDEVVSLLNPLGRAVALEEGLLDAATAVMACSPAYLALAAEALIEAGEREGLAAGTARELVAEALAGTAALLRAREPAELIRAVASPGGSTEAGLGALDERDAADAFSSAVEASLERMRVSR